MTATDIAALVERLNASHRGWPRPTQEEIALRKEAADALEALQARVQRAETAAEDAVIAYNEVEDRAEKAEAACDMLRDELVKAGELLDADLLTRAEKAAAALRSIKWRSIDKDNMEFAATITYSQMDEIRAFAGDKP